MLSTLAAGMGLTANAPKMSVEQAAAGSHWAVLIAGSASYGNYRHQSDVCHAYHVRAPPPPSTTAYNRAARQPAGLP
jgi:hypothetical protein